MKYNNKLFPHPVLGINDDINGSFSPELTYSSDKDFIKISLTFKLVEHELSKLIEQGKAAFLTQVYCSRTIFREIFIARNTLPPPILIPAFRLRGEVEVHFFICAAFEIPKYASQNFNPEYNKASFEIEKSDILGYGGKATFIANKSPDELKSIASLIRIKNSHIRSAAMYNEYDGEKIEIMLCEEDFTDYQLSIKKRQFINIIHSSIVLPALIDALHTIEKEDSKEFEDKRWYTILKDIKVKSKTQDPFQIAQNILEKPNSQTLETLTNLMEE